MGEEERGFTVRDRRAVKPGPGKAPEPSSTVRDPKIPEPDFTVRDRRTTALRPDSATPYGPAAESDEARSREEPPVVNPGKQSREEPPAQSWGRYGMPRQEQVNEVPPPSPEDDPPPSPEDDEDEWLWEPDPLITQNVPQWRPHSPGWSRVNRGAKGERHSRVIPQDVKIAVTVRDGGRCVSCGATSDLHFDHKIPYSRGGTNTVNNIQLLCGPCNRRKAADDIPF